MIANIFQLGGRQWIKIFEGIKRNADATGLGMDAERALAKELGNEREKDGKETFNKWLSPFVTCMSRRG